MPFFGKDKDEPMTKAELKARDAEIEKIDADMPKKNPMRQAGARTRKSILQTKKKNRADYEKKTQEEMGSFKKGGKVRKIDGIAQRGKTRGRIC
jgi:hypothetical protein